MDNRPLELKLCDEFMALSEDERPLHTLPVQGRRRRVLLLSDGFEERSVGVVEALARAGARFSRVVLGRYTSRREFNDLFRERLESAISCLSPNGPLEIPNRNDGAWVAEALEQLEEGDLFLDVTALSGKGVFGALDALSKWEGGRVALAYAEAEEYWPRRSEWRNLKAELEDENLLPIAVDEKPWLFGFRHSVELVPSHEGFDSGSGSQALIAFLPFKCARLGAVIGAGEYGRVVLIAGRPRLKRNRWRLEALREINSFLIGGWKVVELSTFGYRQAVQELFRLLFEETDLMESSDVHLAATGSKLQTVASWVCSSLLGSIAVLSSSPSVYYPDSFSEGIGRNWFFNLDVVGIQDLRMRVKRMGKSNGINTRAR